MHNLFDPILSEEELAKWLATSRPTLQRQRSDGSGPPSSSSASAASATENPRSKTG
jgi:hypothetical protein